MHAQTSYPVDSIELAYPGLILAGNIRDGIGMADRIKQGRTIAEEIIVAKVKAEAKKE